MRRRAIIAGVGTALVLAGCGSTRTVTVSTPGAERAPLSATTARPANTPRKVQRRFNNPAQPPDPSVTAYCNQVRVGHACHAVTAAPEDPNESPQRNCDTNIVANSHTSCGLAENAFYEYYETRSVGYKKSASIGVHSPRTGGDYELGCEQREGLVACISSPTSDGIFVDFPVAAVENYTEAQAEAYAASRDVGHPKAPYKPPSEPSPAPSASPSPNAGEDEVGSYSHATDETFCEEHECIGDFEGEEGYVVECVDGSYSHAGGIQGACSDHGGES